MENENSIEATEASATDSKSDSVSISAETADSSVVPASAPASTTVPVVRRPLKGVGQLLKETWSIYKSKLWTAMGLLLIPILLLSLSTTLGESIVTPLIVLISILLMVFAQGALIILFINRDVDLKVGEIVKKTWSKYWSLIWVSILVSFITVGGFFLLVVPGIIFSIWFLFPLIVLLAEGERGMDALVKSREYVRNYFWPTLGRYFFLVLVIMVFSMVAGTLVGVIFLGSKLGGFVAGLLPLLLIPATVCYSILLYEDLKGAKEVSVQKPKAKTTYLLVGLAGWIFFVVMVVVALTFAAAFLGWLMGGGLDNLKGLPNRGENFEMKIEIPDLLENQGEPISSVNPAI